MHVSHQESDQASRDRLRINELEAERDKYAQGLATIAKMFPHIRHSSHMSPGLYAQKVLDGAVVAPDMLLAENLALRKALENLAFYVARISPPPYGHRCMWCAGCVEQVQAEARAALTTPATDTALGRVRREAQAEVLEEFASSGLAGLPIRIIQHTAILLRDKAAELRGGE